MKNFRFKWEEEEIFLLHIQLNNERPERAFACSVSHLFDDGKKDVETYNVPSGRDSFRFMVSRSHPLETGMEIEYPDDVVLEAYKLDDRAYYPTTAFFVG